MVTTPFSDALRLQLASLGEVQSVRDLVGGRGRTFLLEHGGAAEPVRSVVHLRTAGVAALEREAAATRRAHQCGVGPEVLLVLPAHGALVTRWVVGTALTADLLMGDRPLVRDIGLAVRRLHDGTTNVSGPDVRTALVPLSPLGARRGYLDEAESRGLVWAAEVAGEQRRVDIVAAQLSAGPQPTPVVCHGDLVPGNLVRSRSGAVTLLDHEYAGLAEPAFDLGGLAATAELDEPSIEALVAGYGTRPGVTMARVRAWRDVTRHAWFVWVALGEELGPETQRWGAWADRARAGWAAHGRRG